MGREEGEREKGVVLRPRKNGSRGEEGGGGRGVERRGYNFQDTTHRQQSIYIHVRIYTPSTQSTLTLSTPYLSSNMQRGKSMSILLVDVTVTIHQ